jgi:segregation and condensation protein B
MIRKRPESATRSKGSRKSGKAKASHKAGSPTGSPDSDATQTEPTDGGEEAPQAAADSPEPEEAQEAQEAQEAAPKKPKSRRKKESVDFDSLALRLEALLFASGQALGTRRLSKALGVPAEDVHKGLEVLQKNWSERSSALELVEASGGWRLMTRVAYHEDVAQLAAKTKLEKLSPAALETLAVVAYRQPIGRADIEAVRGVQCGPLLRVLLDRDLIRITGRSSEPGHPLLYGTSKRFLDHFGLASLKNLPDVKDLLNVS